MLGSVWYVVRTVISCVISAGICNGSAAGTAAAAGAAADDDGAIEDFNLGTGGSQHAMLTGPSKHIGLCADHSTAERPAAVGCVGFAQTAQTTVPGHLQPR